MSVFLAVEQVIPADHPAAILAVPLGLLFFGGSVFMLLWSNYGAKKAAAMYGTAFFGFGFLLGVFFWFGAPGIPPSLGITHLPGQTAVYYDPIYYGFEQGSERAEFFTSSNDPDSFQTVPEFLGLEGLSVEELNIDPLYADTVGSVDQSVGVMQNQYLPVDENGVAQIGSERRLALEEQVAELIESEPDLAADGVRRAPTFFTSEPVGEPRMTDDPSGMRVVTQQFQTVANFVDADGRPDPARDPGCRRGARRADRGALARRRRDRLVRVPGPGRRVVPVDAVDRDQRPRLRAQPVPARPVRDAGQAPRARGHRGARGRRGSHRPVT